MSTLDLLRRITELEAENERLTELLTSMKANRQRRGVLITVTPMRPEAEGGEEHVTLEIRCDCCQRVNPPGIRAANKFLMGDWIDHICFACFERWYDYGETDPAVIRAAVLAKSEPERDAARAEVERLNEQADLIAMQRDALATDLARVRAALETAANRLDIAASVIRSGAKFARWADEARAALEGRG